MLYAGIDYHKRYSQVLVIDHSGRTRATARLANHGRTVGEFFKSLEEPCAAVLEAGWNCGVMYDWLAVIDNLKEVELAHPFRVRAIAAAQVKTDAIDAHTLAQLLRSNLIPRAYIPGVETRRVREVVRQRAFLVRVRTMVKNRIHALLDRYHVPAPAVSDMFGKRGRDYLAKVELPAGAQDLLRQDLTLLEALSREDVPPNSGCVRACVAIRLDPYFRPHFAQRRAHKPAQSAIIATARRLLEVVWHVLKENRPYQTRPPAGPHRVQTSSAARAAC